MKAILEMSPAADYLLPAALEQLNTREKWIAYSKPV